MCMQVPFQILKRALLWALYVYRKSRTAWHLHECTETASFYSNTLKHTLDVNVESPAKPKEFCSRAGFVPGGEMRRNEIGK